MRKRKDRRLFGGLNYRADGSHVVSGRGKGRKRARFIPQRGLTPERGGLSLPGELAFLIAESPVMQRPLLKVNSGQVRC